MTVLKQTKYLNFTELPSKGKTKIIGVGNNNGMKLAYTKLLSGWRRYVFMPFPDTIFDVGCLGEIAEFINELMEARKT